jgi:hypothetical protein
VPTIAKARRRDEQRRNQPRRKRKLSTPKIKAARQRLKFFLAKYG